MISKQIFDYCLGIILLLILIIPIIIIWILCTIDTKQNGFFLQNRIGKHGKTFLIFKFRTISGNTNSTITTNKMNISKFGNLLRNSSIDEIPQLINILNGTMSFVGPRPDVEGYADKLLGEDKIILNVKPGITGPAQLKYKNEEILLNNSEDPKLLNDSFLWPDKVIINKEYVKNMSFFNDLKYIFKTIF